MLKCTEDTDGLCEWLIKKGNNYTCAGILAAWRGFCYIDVNM